MKNFVISSVLISVLAIVTIYVLKSLGVYCFDQAAQIVIVVVMVVAMLATIITSCDSFGLKVLAAVSNFAAAYVFAYSFIYLNGLHVFLTIIPAFLTLWLMVDIRDEMEDSKERMAFVRQMTTLMLAQFVIVSIAIIQLAKM